MGLSKTLQMLAAAGSLVAIAHLSEAIALPAGSCQDQTALIESESRCGGDAGIPLTSDLGKVGCFAEPAVQSACGPDGRLTRLHAWTEWLRQLKEFQDRCSDQGGEFAFADPHFSEPADESYCLPAQAELGSSFFEEPTCNLRSLCPAVEVVCLQPCTPEAPSAKLHSPQVTLR